jgi:hypothetical protein
MDNLLRWLKQMGSGEETSGESLSFLVPCPVNSVIYALKVSTTGFRAVVNDYSWSDRAIDVERVARG